jgi:hypothetical protein
VDNRQMLGKARQMEDQGAESKPSQRDSKVKKCSRKFYFMYKSSSSIDDIPSQQGV